MWCVCGACVCLCILSVHGNICTLICMISKRVHDDIVLSELAGDDQRFFLVVREWDPSNLPEWEFRGITCIYLIFIIYFYMLFYFICLYFIFVFTFIYKVTFLYLNIYILFTCLCLFTCLLFITFFSFCAKQ